MCIRDRTHISLLSKCPSYIIGHEKIRHTVELNRFNIPTSFRYVTDYRAIDADTIVSDLQQFINVLINIGNKNPSFEEVIKEDTSKLKELIKLN